MPHPKELSNDVMPRPKELSNDIMPRPKELSNHVMPHPKEASTLKVKYRQMQTASMCHKLNITSLNESFLIADSELH